MENEVIKQQLAPVKAAMIGLALIPPPGSAGVRPVAFTGFCVQFGERVFWITAAHVIEEIERALDAFSTARLFVRAINGNEDPIPFRYDPGRVVRMDLLVAELFDSGMLILSGDAVERDDITAMDIAALELDVVYVKGLTVKGLRPIEEASLGWPALEEVEACEPESDLAIVLHGILAESIQVTGQDGSFTYVWKGLPLEPDDFSKPRLTFKPIWSDEQHQGGVTGMSGGPIAMVGIGPARIGAVQSSQLRIGSGRPSLLRAWDIQIIRQILAQFVADAETGR